MAVREFNGSSDRLTLDDGTAGTIANAAQSIVCLLKPTSLGAGEAFVSMCSGTGTIRTMYDNAGGSVGIGGDTGGDHTAAASLSASAWQVVGYNIAGGIATPRVHRKVLGSGSWTHADADGTLGPVATDVDNFKVDTFGDGTGAKDMRIAVAAVFTSSLTDTNFVDIETNASTAFLQSLSPQVLWEFDQASVATAVTDVMGTGADQTSITGTTAVTGDDPAWTFTDSVVYQFARPDADTTTTGWATAPLYSKINDQDDGTLITATLA